MEQISSKENSAKRRKLSPGAAAACEKVRSAKTLAQQV